VEVTTGSSGLLQQQVRQGAPVDFFLSADRARVDELAAEGTIDASTVRVYAIGRMVLAQRPDAPALARSTADLATPAFSSARIAIANPATAPYGAAARQALAALGLEGPALEQRLVVADNIAQALEFSRTGNADIAFASASNLPPRGIHAVEVDPSLHAPIEQACGLTPRGAARRQARDFQAFLLGDEGRALLSGHGFGLPPP
jgi:molybdate transport system substrate-binding protein